MEPSIHEPALMQTVKEQYDNFNEFGNFLKEIYKDLVNHYYFLDEIEYKTQELWNRLQECRNSKYSKKEFYYLCEATKDAKNMLEGIHFLQDAIRGLGKRFEEGVNTQNLLYQPFVFEQIQEVFYLNKFREFPDPRFERVKFLNQ